MTDTSKPSIPTPEYFTCLTEPRFRYNVYEPEADTFLFLSALEKDSALLWRWSPRRCLEVGCGSGTVITYLHTVLCCRGEAPSTTPPNQCNETAFYAVDVNPVALESAGVTWYETGRKQFDAFFPVDYRSTSLEHQRELPGSAMPTGSNDSCRHSCLHLLEGDLFAPLALHLDEGVEVDPFDVILFNPPYVPTSMDELRDAVKKKDLITAAWCGGTKGRVVLDRFLHALPQHLACPGVCYIVLIKENEPDEVGELVREIFSMGSPEETVKFDCVDQRYTGEHLGVYRISRGIVIC